ncbi:MAG: sodium/proton-translocating pyrophosphatase, partial [Dehalococcoidia bacterium]
MLLGQVLLPATVAICLSLAVGAALLAVGKRNRVEEGGDGVAAATATFAALHYGAGLVLALVASLSAGALVGVLRQSPESGAAVGIAVSVGGLLAAVVGLVGTLVAAAAAGDAPSEARKSTRRQLAGGAVTSLLAASFAVGGVAGLFAVFTRLLDHPAGDAALEVAGFALGASIVGFVAQVGAGVFAESALVAHLLLPRIDRTISPSELENASSTTRAAGQHASASAVSGASAFETTAAGLVGALVLGVANYQVTDNAGWLLLPLLTMAVGTLATVLGLAWPFVVGRRGPALRQATTTGLWLVFL